MDVALAVVVILFVYLAVCVKVLREYERGVVYRLGRVRPVRRPGLVFVPWPIESMERVDMRVQTLELDPQDIITKDNVSITIKPVLYYQVVDAVRSEIEIDGYEDAAQNLAATTLRYIGGSRDLDEVLVGSQRLSEQVRATVDEQTEPWGIAIRMIEIRNIDLPEGMKRAIAAQAEAERERRAKIIAAEGELQASEKLTEAARKMSESPISVQLRYMQTLTEIGAENDTIVVFPLPVELFSHLANGIRAAQVDPNPRIGG